MLNNHSHFSVQDVRATALFRLKHHRSQRPYQLPEGVSYYEHFQRLGLQFLEVPSRESR